MSSQETRARIYIRRNGSYGSAVDEIQDTGHTIIEDSGRFTVYSVHDEDVKIAENASRGEAAIAIADDWRATGVLDRFRRPA